MPYELLDAIERAAIRDKHSPMEVFSSCTSQFRQYTAEQLLDLDRTILSSLVPQSMETRTVLRLRFHVDDENLDPKTWCRFPILSGGYERELIDLRQYVAVQKPR